MLFGKSIGIYGLGLSLRRCGSSFVRFNSSKSVGLDWVGYFKLKKQSSRINTVCSVITGIGGAAATISVLGNIEIDPEKKIAGLDPFIVFGGLIFIGGGFGYLLGPFIGEQVFKVANRSIFKEYSLKERKFLTRVKQHRVDPTSLSLSNPIPDYYGEKIYDIKGYKQWLRDCNAYRRKSKEFI